MLYLILAALFLVIAVLYTAVGFGGGSSYIALLALTELPYQVIPVVALVCNISAVTVSLLLRQLELQIEWSRALALTALAIPFGFLGGLTPIKEQWFFYILGLSLFLSSWSLILKSGNPQNKLYFSRWFLYLASCGLGYIAGLVGIGGGIFLAPVLYHSDYQKQNTIPATLSVYILGNSVFGLLGQLSKHNFSQIISYESAYLVGAVLLGALTGTRISLRWISKSRIRQATGILILLVSIRLLYRTLAM